ncbi:hypothetical protein LTR56_019311 [Elasticomyces elasticus]|nr:hypothetical protein LTR56_019311 [Elasticomyces elasticus]KAK3635324.1 hypothetical protein LTR22_019252 [Elasticomyces elasticus]KAK5734886.1 hypothetical protein LTS12_026602 [Elasticomyces elasticus]
MPIATSEPLLGHGRIDMADSLESLHTNPPWPNPRITQPHRHRSIDKAMLTPTTKVINGPCEILHPDGGYMQYSAKKRNTKMMPTPPPSSGSRWRKPLTTWPERLTDQVLLSPAREMLDGHDGMARPPSSDSSYTVANSTSAKKPAVSSATVFSSGSAGHLHPHSPNPQEPDVTASSTSSQDDTSSNGSGGKSAEIDPPMKQADAVRALDEAREARDDNCDEELIKIAAIAMEECKGTEPLMTPIPETPKYNRHSRSDDLPDESHLCRYDSEFESPLSDSVPDHVLHAMGIDVDCGMSKMELSPGFEEVEQPCESDDDDANSLKLGQQEKVSHDTDPGTETESVASVAHVSPASQRPHVRRGAVSLLQQFLKFTTFAAVMRAVHADASVREGSEKDQEVSQRLLLERLVAKATLSKLVDGVEVLHDVSSLRKQISFLSTWHPAPETGKVTEDGRLTGVMADIWHLTLNVDYVKCIEAVLGDDEIGTLTPFLRTSRPYSSPPSKMRGSTRKRRKDTASELHSSAVVNGDAISTDDEISVRPGKKRCRRRLVSSRPSRRVTRNTIAGELDERLDVTLPQRSSPGPRGPGLPSSEADQEEAFGSLSSLASDASDIEDLVTTASGAVVEEEPLADRRLTRQVVERVEVNAETGDRVTLYRSVPIDVEDADELD